MSRVRFGIVGTGVIAGIVADAISQSKCAALAAVSSRTLEKARSFVSGRESANSAEPVEGLDELLRRTDVDAIYISSPTIPRESITLASIAAGKHVLVEKPFLNLASVRHMTDAAGPAHSSSWTRLTSFTIREPRQFKPPSHRSSARHARCTPASTSSSPITQTSASIAPRSRSARSVISAGTPHDPSWNTSARPAASPPPRRAPRSILHPAPSFVPPACSCSRAARSRPLMSVSAPASRSWISI
ncbi:MAG: Gfo/Idh/MocA family oxidoreductase [Phycisphaeraceae bacterium]|nr:Gfo/Idh/MocA family oxidoreductase [Phycisphaeraceae bacterium]